MKKFKFLSAILTVALAVQFFAVTASAKLVVGVSGVPAKKAEFVQPLSIPAQTHQGNRLSRSNFDASDSLEFWTTMSASMRLEWLGDKNGGYLRTDCIPYNYYGFRFAPLFEVEPGIYKFEGYFRTYNQDEVTSLRVEFVDYENYEMETLVVNCGNEWQKVEYYVTITNTLQHINVCGAGYVEFIQDYCMDEFSLVEVDEIPEGANATKRFGAEVDRAKALEITYKNAGGFSETFDPETYHAKYKTNGVMLNNDADGTLHNVGNANGTVTEDDIINAIMQYKDTQVTDFMLTVCNEIATYPSLVWMSYLDKYYQTEENGVEVDYTESAPTKGAQHIWETLHTDYIGLWAELLPEMGINPWLSFRMNDAHDRSKETSFLLSDFYHENPQFRRVTHRTYGNMGNLYDYTHPEVREHYLALINEALSRYEVYGIELDFQRERYLWYIGGEYNGLDILNDFMRDVDDIVSVYEEKYGHEIKFAVRVPSDPQTCYEHGFDIPTWAAEGIIHHVTVTGRFEVTDLDMPIRLWDSILTPFGVTLAAGIDTSYVRHTAYAANAGWTPELYAGFCANAYSQGADKVYILNLNTGITNVVPEKEKVTVGVDSTIKALNTRWFFTTNMGSYDKVLEMNRRCTVTFNDSPIDWKSYEYVLPMTIVPDSTAILRIPVGDITVGSKVTLDISFPEYKIKDDMVVPTVYVNSELCTYESYGSARPGGTGVFTEDPVLHYSVPVEAHDETYFVIEIMYDGAGGYTMEHAEVYIEPLG